MYISVIPCIQINYSIPPYHHHTITTPYLPHCCCIFWTPPDQQHIKLLEIIQHNFIKKMNSPLLQTHLITVYNADGNNICMEGRSQITSNTPTMAYTSKFTMTKQYTTATTHNYLNGYKINPSSNTVVDYNCLPLTLKLSANNTQEPSISDFKSRLDWLTTIPDQPTIHTRYRTPHRT